MDAQQGAKHLFNVQKSEEHLDKNLGDNAQSQKTMIYNTPQMLKGTVRERFVSINFVQMEKVMDYLLLEKCKILIFLEKPSFQAIQHPSFHLPRKISDLKFSKKCSVQDLILLLKNKSFLI